MAAENYFADTMTLATYESEDGSPVSIPFGSLKEVMIEVEAEHNELTSTDSIKRDNIAKSEFSVTFQASSAAFDMTLVEEWLGGDGTSSTTLTDDNTVETFHAKGQITSKSSTTLNADVTGIYFPSLPVMDASEGEWVTRDVEGVGKAIDVS